MSREEAIDIIKCLAWHTRPNEEDIEQAIKVLKQEPCEDAISRQAAIEVAKQYWYKPDIAGALAELPPVQLQTKTGHWILQPSNKEQGERDFIWWKCSECGQVIYSETEKDRREYHAFCGRCGKRMIEPQENEG